MSSLESLFCAAKQKTISAIDYFQIDYFSEKIDAWNYAMNMFTQTNLINLTLLSYLLLGDYLVTKLATCSLVSTAHGKLFLACTRIVNELTMA